MTQSPASGQSTSTKTILIGAFGCVLAVFMIGMIILGIVGFRMLSGDGFDISNIVNRSSDDVYIEEEGSPLDLLGSENVDSEDDKDNQPSGGMQDSGSEFAGIVLQAAEEFEDGYANLEWKQFLYIEAGNGYSPAQAEASSVFFDLKFDLGEGYFSGSAQGDLSGQELQHQEKGNFSITDISGELAENPQGSGYVLEGKGTVSCQIEMKETYTDGAGKQYPYQRSDSFSGQVDLTGKLMLLNNTWELDLSGRLDNGTQSFHLNCIDCPVGTWEK